jgi:uncharacterized protein (DUF169 family)
VNIENGNDAQSLLGLAFPPVAIGFLAEAPAGVEPWRDGPVPAGCAFWKEAQAGRTFTTTPEDHFGCAVGAYTHRIELPVARSGELGDTITFMVQAGYLNIEEVPGIPTLSQVPAYIAYGPVDQVPFSPSVVLVALKPSRAMVLYEAALQVGVTTALMPALGRPACAVLPLTLQTEAAAISLGCAGNRTFTGLPDDALYVGIPGSKWPAVVERLAQICDANQTMRAHYASRL